MYGCAASMRSCRWILVCSPLRQLYERLRQPRDLPRASNAS
jgi:hypothetical protein